VFTDQWYPSELLERLEKWVTGAAYYHLLPRLDPVRSTKHVIC